MSNSGRFVFGITMAVFLGSCNPSPKPAQTSSPFQALPQTNSGTFSGKDPSALAPAAVATNAAGPVLFRTAADPHIIYVGGMYYMTASSGGPQQDIRLRSASSVAGLWKATEQVIFSGQSEPSDRNAKVWAPEIYRLNGPNGWRWYVYYSAGEATSFDKQRAYVLESSSDNPYSSYSYKGRLFNGSDNFYAIDATTFTVGSQRYLAWSGTDLTTDGGEQKVFISAMSNPWTLTGSRVQISAPTNAWERNERGINEAPAVLVKNNKVFMTYSASACWSDDYALGLLTAPSSANLLNPASWVKSGPVFSKNPAKEVYATGHNGFFSSPNGETWQVYHANPKSSSDLGNETCLDFRTARIQKVNFDGSGNPVFGTPNGLHETFALPGGDPGFNFDAPVAGNTYRLFSQQAGLCLDVDNGSSVRGTNASLWTCNSLVPQDWTLADAGGGYFYLKSKVGNNQCLDVAGGFNTPGTNVQIWDCNNLNPQKWKFVGTGGGYHRLESALGSLALDVAGGGVRLKSNVATWTPNGLAPQNWMLERR